MAVSPAPDRSAVTRPSAWITLWPAPGAIRAGTLSIAAGRPLSRAGSPVSPTGASDGASAGNFNSSISRAARAPMDCHPRRGLHSPAPASPAVRLGPFLPHAPRLFPASPFAACVFVSIRCLQLQ